jgi:hypothetical protein
MLGQEQKNIRALRDWSTGSASCSLAEYAQILSGPLQELPSLVESDGRFWRLMEDFERWMVWVDEVLRLRRESIDQVPDLSTVEALGDAWKAENAALTRKLTSYSRDLQRLSQPAQESSIAVIVSACRCLVDGILEELHVMRRIEDDVLAREKEWVEGALKAIARDISVHLGPEEACEAWRI